MTVRLHSYVGFNGNAKEAMEFYKSIFGGEVFSDTFSSFKTADMPIAPEDADKIMHAFLKGDNSIELMGADVPSTMAFDTGTRMTLSLSGDDEELLRSYWDKLSEGGTITVPIATSPWGDTFGMLTDKFEVNWMIDIGPIQGG